MIRPIAIVLALATSAWAHNPMDGRVCTSSSCGMCSRNHLVSGHGIDGWGYQNPWAIHRNLHDPSSPLAKKLAVKRLPFDPTPRAELLALRGIVSPRADDLIYDPGCGDARLLIALCKYSGARGVGIEINPKIAALAKREVIDAGMIGRIRIWNADSRKIDMGEATVVVAYLFPKLLDQLNGQWQGARIVCSYLHTATGVAARQDGKWYVWGEDKAGRLGDNSVQARQNIPKPRKGREPWSSI